MKVKKQQVLNCMFSAWYPNFKNHTIKSFILPIPAEFLDYLHSDGIVLPEEAIKSDSERDDLADDLDRILGDDDDTVDWDSSDTLSPAQVPNFPEFEKNIKKCMERLGGRVIPKLNWSAPRDATWISFDKTLKCTCPSDIYLLLKSSDFIVHDLTQPFKYCEDVDEGAQSEVKYELVLRRWHEINPGGEFRCFIRDKKLIAISQRHHSNYYDFIQPDEEHIVADIKSFYYHVIQDKFPETNYVVDVYRKDRGKVYVIDFNPFGEVTDSLLFTWEELTAEKGLSSADEDETKTDDPVFHYIRTPFGVQPSPYQAYGLPTDIVDIASGADSSKFIDFLKLQTQRQRENSETENSQPSDSEESSKPSQSGS